MTWQKELNSILYNNIDTKDPTAIPVKGKLSVELEDFISELLDKERERIYLEDVAKITKQITN